MGIWFVVRLCISLGERVRKGAWVWFFFRILQLIIPRFWELTKGGPRSLQTGWFYLLIHVTILCLPSVRQGTHGAITCWRWIPPPPPNKKKMLQLTYTHGAINFCNFLDFSLNLILWTNFPSKYNLEAVDEQNMATALLMFETIATSMQIKF